MLNATQVAARVAAAAALFTALPPSPLAARQAWCDTSLYTTRVLGDTPLLYWRLDESVSTVAYGNCGFNDTVGVIAPFAASNGLGRGVSAPAAAFPPNFDGAAVMSCAVPSSLVWPVASLFKARAEAYASLHVSPAVVLEAMVFSSAYTALASVVAIDLGAPGGKVDLLVGCASGSATCAASGGSPALVLTQAAGAAQCVEGALTVASPVDGLMPLGVWTHVVAIVQMYTNATISGVNGSTATPVARSNCPSFNLTSVELLVNGAPVANLTRTFVAASAPRAAAASPAVAVGGNGFTGSIAEVAVYAHVLNASVMQVHASAAVMALPSRAAACSDSTLSPVVLADAPYAFWPMNEATGASAALACGILDTALAYGAGATAGGTLRDIYNEPPVTTAAIAPQFAGTGGVALGASIAATLFVNSPSADNTLLTSAFASSAPNGVGLTIEALVVAEKFAAGSSIMAAVKADGGGVNVIVSCKAARDCEASGLCSVATACAGSGVSPAVLISHFTAASAGAPAVLLAPDEDGLLPTWRWNHVAVVLRPLLPQATSLGSGPFTAAFASATGFEASIFVNGTEVTAVSRYVTTAASTLLAACGSSVCAQSAATVGAGYVGGIADFALCALSRLREALFCSFSPLAIPRSSSMRATSERGCVISARGIITNAFAPPCPLPSPLGTSLRSAPRDWRSTPGSPTRRLCPFSAFQCLCFSRSWAWASKSAATQLSRTPSRISCSRRSPTRARRRSTSVSATLTAVDWFPCIPP